MSDRLKKATKKRYRKKRVFKQKEKGWKMTHHRRREDCMQYLLTIHVATSVLVYLGSGSASVKEGRWNEVLMNILWQYQQSYLLFSPISRVLEICCPSSPT